MWSINLNMKKTRSTKKTGGSHSLRVGHYTIIVYWNSVCLTMRVKIQSNTSTLFTRHYKLHWCIMHGRVRIFFQLEFSFNTPQNWHNNQCYQFYIDSWTNQKTFFIKYIMITKTPLHTAGSPGHPHPLQHDVLYRWPIRIHKATQENETPQECYTVVQVHIITR